MINVMKYNSFKPLSKKAKMKHVISPDSQNKRINLLLAFLWLLFLVIIFRLYYIQIKLHPQIAKKADRVHYKKVRVYPKRGMILERNGNVLAISIETYTVSIFPDIFNGFDRVDELAGILGCSPKYLEDRLDTDANYVRVARKINKKRARRVRQWLKEKKIAGLRIEEDEKRFYPNSFEGKHILGSVRRDNVGNEGIEKYFDDTLRGEPEEYYVERKKIMQPLRLVQFEDFRNSTSIMLTIDENIQHFVEVALDRAYRETGAKSCVGIVMNPFSGEILAMAVKPDYDPSRLGSIESEEGMRILDSRRIKSITDYYEPGSTFKIILFSSAIDSGIIDPESEETIFCEQGSYRVADRIIHDYLPFGYLTIKDILVKSSNIGCTKIAERLGDEQFYNYIKKFGFGEKTDIDLPGESPGSLADLEDWDVVKRSQISFGQGIGVTAIQMITAVSAVANGGFLRKPTLIKAVIDENGKVEDQIYPKFIRRVISQKTAESISNMLTLAVDEGTGKNARIPGYRIAGKTGTAQKYIKGQGYSNEKLIVSFIGFAPAENPKFIIYVVIDEPGGKEPSGGKDAAPVFREIALRLLSYYRILPSEEI